MSALNGKYVLDRRLGGGGMAEVFLARTVGAEGFEKTVAIKRVLPGFSDQPAFSSMFVSEARLTSQLHHTNIVSVLDFDRDADGRLFLVMEFVDGTDLDGLLRTGPLPFSLVIFVAVEILRGLDHAHDLPVRVDGVKGIVHRDISPHNVLVGWDGAVKVSDFGIAKLRAHTSATASVMVKGKPAWMSPEQARGDKLDGRSDLFAVGIMLFEMLCQQRLFEADSTEATLARVWYAEIPSVNSVRPDVPTDLAAVVDWLLQRDLTRRAPNAGAVIEALLSCQAAPVNGRGELSALLSERFPGRAPVRVRTNPRAIPGAPTITGTPRVTKTAAPPAGPGVAATSTKATRATVAIVAAVVLGLLGVGVIGALVSKDGGAPAVRPPETAGPANGLSTTDARSSVDAAGLSSTAPAGGVDAGVASSGPIDAGGASSAPPDAGRPSPPPRRTPMRDRDSGIREVPLGGK